MLRWIWGLPSIVYIVAWSLLSTKYGSGNAVVLAVVPMFFAIGIGDSIDDWLRVQKRKRRWELEREYERRYLHDPDHRPRRH